MQDIVDKMKDDLLEYLPIYINYDLKLPESFDVPMDFYGWTLNQLHFSNIRYDLIYMDLKKFKFEFTQYEYEQVVFITFPFLRAWRLNADWALDWNVWPLVNSGKLIFTITDVGLNTAFSMRANNDGSI